MSDELKSMSCAAFTERLASREPTPGGGGAAALIGALAASLGSMAVQLSMGKKKLLPYEADHRRLAAESEALRLRFLSLIDGDAAAFSPLSAAYAMDKSDPDRPRVFREATLAACRAPFEMMQCCCDLIALLEELRDKCSALLLSDVGCAAFSARAALERASLNVFVNTRCLPEDAEAATLAEEAKTMLFRFVPRAAALAEAVADKLN